MTATFLSQVSPTPFCFPIILQPIASSTVGQADPLLALPTENLTCVYQRIGLYIIGETKTIFVE
jgi:hypothetical protein